MDISQLELISTNIGSQLHISDRFQLDIDQNNADFFRDNWGYLSRVKEFFISKGYHVEVIARGREDMRGGDRMQYSLILSRRRQNA